MIYETTYSSREIALEINKLVGKPYSLLERIKMGGIGSKRMPIHNISEEYAEYLNAEHYITYANIELRPKGIVVHFRYKLESYSWPMAYDNLTIEKAPVLTLKSEDRFISFKDGLMLNEKFVEKIIFLSKN